MKTLLVAYLANKIFTSNFRNSLQINLWTTKSFWFSCLGQKQRFLFTQWSVNLHRRSPSQMFYNISALKFLQISMENICAGVSFRWRCRQLVTSLKQRLQRRYFLVLLSSSNTLLWLSAIFLSCSNVVCFDYQNQKRVQSLLRMYFAQLL